MRATVKSLSLLAATLLVVVCVVFGPTSPRSVAAQGYSGAAPNVSATAATGLGLTYTSGTIVSGGTQTAITGSTLTATDTQSNCTAPAYSSCNIVYWTSGSSLSITTTPGTAFASGNVVVAFVTASGGNIVAVTPASWNLPTQLLRTSSANTGNAYWVPPGACTPTVSANATGTNGLTSLGASFVAAVQAQTTNTGTNTHTYVCHILPPTTVGVSGRGASVTDAVFFYGVQTTGLGTQVSSTTAGTLNSSIVFSTITLPAPGATETPSTVTPVRADSGSLTILPTVGAFNVATTTAGAFYSVKFTPASPIAVTTDLTDLLLTVSLLNTATSATITNSIGVLVHYAG